LIHEHLDPAALDRILALDRTEDQNRGLLHQIAVCPACRAVGGWLLDLQQAGLLSLRFGPVDLALARSRAEAPRLWERLAPLAPEDRFAAVRASRAFASWGLCELLCRDSRAAASGDPARATHLGELAVLVADLIPDEEPAETRWVYQLRAWAWGHLGNALRLQDELRQADEAFAVSRQWWQAGESDVGDALGYGPQLLSLEASLRTDQRRFREAQDLLDQVHDAYLHGDPEHRDHHLAGRALVQKSHILLVQGEPEQAIPVLQQATELVEPQRDPRLNLCLRHNLLDCLSKAGRYAEAEALLPDVRSLSREVGTPIDEIRLDWAAGRIAAGLGRREEAREAFAAVRREFLARDMAFDAALVTLELATLSIEEGKTAEVKIFAGEIAEIFRTRDVHREALAALTVFQNAALLETATAELAREVAASLTRARNAEGGS
jgi:tetratricopeptide (TPR) repeat protein